MDALQNLGEIDLSAPAGQASRAQAPDIFDQVATSSPGDIFDQVSETKSPETLKWENEVQNRTIASVPKPNLQPR